MVYATVSNIWDIAKVLNVFYFAISILTLSYFKK